MKTLDSDWRTWHDWQRVLVAWRHRYSRTGLTPHCIASLCDRPPEDILSEILDDRTAHPQYCATIGSPILSMRLGGEWDGGKLVYSRTIEPSLIGNYSLPNYARGKSWAETVDELLTKYPWPKFKSISNMKGVKSVGLERVRQFQLMEIAQGNLIPTNLLEGN